MNIFLTSYCPVECAKNLDDKRVVKMTLETGQLLSTALRYHGVTDERLYRSTHENHPCSVWARESSLNYMWLLAHFESLLNEYQLRYDKFHKTGKLLPLFYLYLDYIPNGGLTDFANCAGNKEKGISYKHIEDVPKAYTEYLNHVWKIDKRVPTWYGRRV